MGPRAGWAQASRSLAARNKDNGHSSKQPCIVRRFNPSFHFVYARCPSIFMVLSRPTGSYSLALNSVCSAETKQTGYIINLIARIPHVSSFNILLHQLTIQIPIL